MTGRLFQINISPGGLPKLPIIEGVVGELGVMGDGHNWKGHGGPMAAICLFSLERIMAMQERGNPIFPGALGENFTVSGIDWDLMQPGTRLKVGDEVVLELTQFATPCPKLNPYLKDEEIDQVSAEKHPGWARPYAKVIQSGTVRTGDAVEIIEG
ncbi:MAG: MOSC domain-containing protein [Anaerolineaceae bacterium]|nr:MOSC domain-containing protein [Anaerolineaceae bacterium]